MGEARVVTAPRLDLDAATLERYRALLVRARTDPREPLDLPDGVPAHQFLRWLAEVEGFLLHGSNNATIGTFLPRPQTDAEQRATAAVFATPDGLWPMYFAIVDRTRRHLLRNGFWRDDDGIRHYRFAVDEQTLRGRHFVTGAVYVLEAAGFAECLTDEGAPTEEWLSHEPVTPLARVRVRPQDFPFLADIATVDASGAFAFADALVAAERAASSVTQDSRGLVLTGTSDLRSAAETASREIAHLELADVTCSISSDAEMTTFRLNGSPALLSTVRAWARLPS